MSALNFAMDVEAACQSFCEKALGDAIANRDHSEALHKLDRALSELRAVETVARYFAARLGCAKDVWYVLHDMTRKDEVQIDAIEVDLGTRFSLDMGGTPPTVEKMVELLGIQEAAASLVREIDNISGGMEDADLSAAWERAKALKPKNPFKVTEPIAE
jgi:hypothetical protein